MTIEITRPEVEALIRQRLSSGNFADPQDLILEALRNSNTGRRMGTELIAAMQAFPFKEDFDLETEPVFAPVRDSEF